MKEYEWLMKALELKEIDEDFKAHRQAFLNFSVQATRNNGKPVYRRFESFYDYERALDEAEEKPKQDRFAGMKNYLRRGKENG